MQIVARVEGAEETARHLRALADDLEEPRDALEDLGREGADTAAALAPRLTGETARSIRPVATLTQATITAPFPAGPINYKTNRFMDRAAEQLEIRASDIMEAAIRRDIERNHL